MKNIHPKTTNCNFTCATCASKFEIKTTIEADTYGIDICSKCHPFYIGKSSNKQLRGKAEKMQSKFEAGKANLGSKSEAKSKERKENANKKSLGSL
ncbi:MAG: 50S ribosomal protein L31 [Mycoplasma sp.]